MTQFNDSGFKDFGLAGTILRAVETEGYTVPTPIQAQAIPYLMTGRDLLGIAQTGTGKTAAFALPILHRLASDRIRPTSRRARALVLAPTRELAAQIADSFKTYGRHTQMHVAVIFGGVSYGPQVKALNRGIDILVATPGRLLDHLEQGTLRLDETEVVVLDEADHMLDLGFIVPIRQVVAKLPVNRQTLFFSATMPREIAKLAGEMLNNPAEVSVMPVGTTAERVEQSVFMVDAGAKNTLLVHLLKQEQFERTLIFTRTKRGADRVAALLTKEGIGSQAIHGNKSQAQREKALASFKRGSTQVLVATDIAARGIDVDAVSHVINYELPDVAEAYVHRIGRTARAGAAGQAIAFCARDERGSLRSIERLTRQPIPAFTWTKEEGVRQLGATQYSAEDQAPAPRRSGGRPQNRNGSAQRPSAPGRHGAANRNREDRPQRQARGADGGGFRGRDDRRSDEPRSGAKRGNEFSAAGAGARNGASQAPAKKEHRKGQLRPRADGNAIRVPTGVEKSGEAKYAKPYSARAESGEPFADRRPNRVGQRRRRKMQAEREAQGAMV